MKLPHRLLAAGLLGALLIPAAPIGAQTMWTNPYTGTTWNNPGSSLLDTMLRGKMNEKALTQSAQKATAIASTPGANAPKTKTAAKVPRVTYKASNTRVPEQIASSLFPDPADAAEIAAFLREAKATFTAEAAKAGRKNDLGFALTYFVAGNYAVFYEDDVSDAATNALNLQLDQLMASTGAMAKATNATKQQLADHFVCVTNLVLAGYRQGIEMGGEQGAAQVEAFKALGGQNLEVLLHLQVENLVLSEAGLRTR